MHDTSYPWIGFLDSSLPKVGELDGHLDEAIGTEALRLDEGLAKALEHETRHLQIVHQTATRMK